MHEQSTAQILSGAFGPSEEADAGRLGLAGLAAQYLLLRRQEEEVDRQHKDLKERLATAEGMLWEALAQAKVKSLRLDSGELLTATSRHSYTLPPKADAGRRAEALVWLAMAGGSDLIQQDVHPSSFNGFCKELVSNDIDLPAFVRDVETRYVSMRK